MNTAKTSMNIKLNRLTTLLILAIFSASATPMFAQQYEVGKNAHSHNDYQQTYPFYTAYMHGFASIEVDVFQVGDKLYVAHDEEKIDPRKTIESLYFNPLLKQIKMNGNNKAYKDGKGLQLMIDFKTSGIPALKCLEAKLKPIRQYFDVQKDPNAVRIVITGETPPPANFKDFDDIFFFDGRRTISYSPEELKRVAFFSANFKDFSKWKGNGKMSRPDSMKVKNFVDSVHQAGKPVRFWGNPDTQTSWVTFMKMGIDYLNTDLPAAIARFLKQHGKLD